MTSAVQGLMSSYTIALRKLGRVLVKKQLGSRQRQLGKTAVIKAGAYIESMDRKITVYELEVGKIAHFEECIPVAHSNASDLHVSSNLAYITVAEPGFIIQYDTGQSPCHKLV